MLILSRIRSESVIVSIGQCGGVLTLLDRMEDDAVVLNWHDLSSATCRKVTVTANGCELSIGDASFMIKLTRLVGGRATLGFQAPDAVRIVRAEARADGAKVAA